MSKKGRGSHSSLGPTSCPYPPKCSERLSEKGSEGGFKGGFVRYEEAQKGFQRAFTVVYRATPGLLPRPFGRSRKALG